MKRAFSWLISGVILVAPLFLSANPIITAEKVNEINDQIAKATNDCDFDEATKYYFKKTKFFNYVSNENDDSISEQSYDEALTSIRQIMLVCPFKLEKEEVISEKVMIENHGEKADFIYDSVHYLRATDGSLYKSRSTGKTVFGIVKSKILILETHYEGISFEQIE